MACYMKLLCPFSAKNLTCSSLPYRHHNFFTRALSTSAAANSNGGEGWFSKLLMVRKIEPGHDSHSRLLSSSDYVYELQIHDVRPDSIAPYLQNYQKWVDVAQTKCEGTELVGSWRVEIGDQDQFIHIWRFKHGYPHASRFLELCRTDTDLQSITREQVSLLRYRENQYMLPFSFWGHPQPRNEKNMFEMRSYVLKPGTMIEWGNNWARGITYRKDSAVAGFFSQIGQLYMVHHIWGYKDLQIRKDLRDSAWRKPGWDECVAHTASVAESIWDQEVGNKKHHLKPHIGLGNSVPLIREMRSRWLLPTSFSPIK